MLTKLLITLKLPVLVQKIKLHDAPNIFSYLIIYVWAAWAKVEKMVWRAYNNILIIIIIIIIIIINKLLIKNEKINNTFLLIIIIIQW